jgi:uncharacterized protein (TIGR02145 family)
MRIVLLVLFIMSFFLLNAQSKKEQIEILNKRVDSLNEIIGSERKINLDKSTKISELTNTIIGLEESISSLSAEVSKLTSELQQSKKELITKTQDFSNLQIQLKIKMDSLTSLHSELDKLKNEILTNQSLVKNKSIEELVIEGQTYKTVKIGNQTWMAENLNVSTFRNGDPIPQAKTNKEWELAGKNKTPAWCYYENDPKNGEKYGKLYNWYAISDYRGLAPEGWHIPANFEYNYLFSNDSIGKSFDQLKSNEYWLPCDLINEHYEKVQNIGFNTLPSGIRNGDGSYDQEFYSANLWTTSLSNFLDVHFDFCPLSIYFYDYNHAFSEIIPVVCREFGSGLSVRFIKN